MDNGLPTADLNDNVEVKFLQPAAIFSHLQTILQNINIPYQTVKEQVERMCELRANCSGGIDMQDVGFEQVANNFRLPKELSVDLVKKRQLFIQSEKFLNQYMGNNLSMKMFSEFSHYLGVGAGNGNSPYNANTLFSAIPAPDEETSEELANLLDELYVKTSTDRIFYNSWLLHHHIIKYAQFFKQRAMVARLMQYAYLKQHHAHLYGLLALEEMLLKHKAEYLQLVSLIPKEETLDVFLAFGSKMHLMALTSTEERIKNVYRNQIGYKKLAPWQRNISNYMFSKGFDMKPAGTDGVLNERQLQIVQIILEEGFVSTKDMVERFNCNRKTIQRDFAELLEANLVRAIGKGSALRYGVNVKDKTRNYLEKYQTVHLDDGLLTAKTARKATPKKQERLDDNQALSQAS